MLFRSELGLRKAVSRERRVCIDRGELPKPPNTASSSSMVVYRETFSWGSMECADFRSSRECTRTDVGPEDRDERLEVADFICSSSSSISRPKMSLADWRVDDAEELFSDSGPVSSPADSAS